MRVRVAHDGDDARVDALAGASPFSDFGVRRRRQTGIVFVLEMRNRVVGTLSVTNIEHPVLAPVVGLRSPVLSGLGVDPDFHGRGIREVLLSKALKIVESWGFARACLFLPSGLGSAPGEYRDLFWPRPYFRRLLRDYEVSVEAPVALGRGPVLVFEKRSLRVLDLAIQ